MFKLESRLKSLYPCLSLPHCLSLSFTSVPVPFYCKEKIKEALCFSQRIETRASSEQSLFIYKKKYPSFALCTQQLYTCIAKFFG